MTKQIIHYWVDLLMIITSLVVIITGLIKFPGWLTAIGINYLSLPMGLFTWLHDWIGLMLVVLVIIHLCLNWKWLMNMTRKIFLKGKGS